MTTQVQQVVERITALRELQAATGTRTTRSQNDLLQSLDDATLIAVAVELKRRDVWAILSGVKKTQAVSDVAQ
jgi:hypothetical protein